MATATKEKKETVKSITFEIEKEKFKKVINAQLDYSAKYETNNLLSGILITASNSLLTFVSTDGNRMLKTEMEMLEVSQSFEPVVYRGINLARIKIIKGIDLPRSCPDWLEITLTNKEMLINDIANKISYKIPALEGKYPKYEQLIKKPENAHTYAVNVNYLKDLKNLQVNERTDIIKLTFNKKSNIQPLYVESDNGEGIKSTTLIMPVQIRS